MFCEKCGARCSDGARFCQNCGAALPEPMPVQTEPVQTESGQTEVLSPENASAYYTQEQVQSAPVYAEGAYCTEPDRGPDVLATVKKLASSPLMLAIAILSTVSLILSFLSNISATALYDSFVGVMEESFAAQGIDVGEIYGNDFFERFADIFNAVVLSSAIVTSIPAIFVCVGYWITNVTARGNFSTAGLTMIKVIQTIKLVFAYISSALYVGCLFLVALGLSAVNNMASGDIPDAVMAIAALVLLIILGALILNIVYITKIRTTLKTVIETAKTGTPKLKGISVFVAVMFILTAVCQIPSMFTIIMPISALLAMTTAAYYVCLAVAIFKYRSEMEKF